MQQFTIEHKSNNQQKIVSKETNQKQELENKREGKGRSLATSKRVYRIQNSDTFYVESENSDNIYYFVRFNPSVFEWCSCPDSSMRQMKCKHLFAIEYAIRLATVKDVEKLPEQIKKEVTKSYTEDDYSF